jgi:hypothetical protein
MNEKLLAANGRHVRLNGISYRIISCKLGSRVLCDAEPIQGDRINLVKSRSPLAKDLRNLIDLNLFV